MKVLVDGKEFELENNATVADVLSKAGINRETVLVKRRGELCAEVEKVAENDVLETVSVISGG